MEALRDNFISSLAAIRERYRHDPKRELEYLLLLALEREEIVSIAYREDRLEACIDQLPISDVKKRLVRSALIWIWKDEEMHTTYVRSVLAQSARRTSRWRILIVQCAGAIGGWSSSVLHHSTWRSAPLSRATAKLVMVAGAFAGKVPTEILSGLKDRTFRNFCEFNIEAESTAELCWRRISELAHETGVGPNLTRAFEQIAMDEENHRRVFTLIADVESTDHEVLADRIAEVGQYFLPLQYRKTQGRFSESGAVWCSAGRTDDEKAALFARQLLDSGLVRELLSRASGLGKSPEEMKIVIKAPFMMIYDKSDMSPAIDLELLSLLISHLRDNGFPQISLLERGNVYERFHLNRSVLQVAKYLRLDDLPITIVDCKDDQVAHRYPRGLGLSSISQSWRDADFRISFGKLRSHPSDQVLMTVSNIEGLGLRWDEYLFFERSANFAAAQATIMTEFPPDFSILDAFSRIPDGMVGVMGHSKARAVRRFYASTNSLALDQTVMRHLGIETQESSVLRELLYWRGENPSTARILGEDSPIDGWRGPHSNDICGFLSLISILFYEYTGRGRLFVPKFDRAAFPPAGPQGPGLNLMRGLLRRIIALQFIGRGN